MKLKKSTRNVILVTIAIILLIAIAIGAFTVAERLYPSAILNLRREFLYLGISAELTEITEDSETKSLEELLSDSRTELENSLILVSSEHPISELSFDSVTEYKDSEVFFDSSAHSAYEKLSAYVLEEYEEKLYILSAYRTREEQQELFDQQGSDTAQRPGESEHETGLALDVAVQGFGGASFLKTDVGKYINLSCWRYGFIIRYPDGKTDITGISYEPWHLRYVGAPHAEFIEKNRLTLEEYLDMLENGKLYTIDGIDGYAVIRTNDIDKITVPDEYSSLTVSPDNCGNYILTFTIE